MLPRAADAAAEGATAAPPAPAATRGMNRNNLEFLQLCFRDAALDSGDAPGPQGGAPAFWTAVSQSAQGVSAALGAPAPRQDHTLEQLQAAYDFVYDVVLRDDPAGRERFVSNGAAGVSLVVPGLHKRVHALLQSVPVAPAGSTAESSALPASAIAPTERPDEANNSVAQDAVNGGADDDEGDDGGGGTRPPFAPFDADSCFLCQRPQTTSNPVSLGKLTDLQALWLACKPAYNALAPVMMCPTRSTNHTHCRSVLRGMGLPTASASGGAAPGFQALRTLDAMARCYPSEQLDEYLEPRTSFKTHRRCRGGLLSLLRVIEASGAASNGDVLASLQASSTVRVRCLPAICRTVPSSPLAPRFTHHAYLLPVCARAADAAVRCVGNARAGFAAPC